MHSKTFSVVTCLLVNVIVAKPLFEGGFMMTDPSNLESMAKKQTIQSDRSKSENLNLPEVKESDKTEEAFSQVPHNRPRISSESESEDNSNEASRELNGKDKLEDQPQKLAKRADVVDKDNLKPKQSPIKPNFFDSESIPSDSTVEKAPIDKKSSNESAKEVSEEEKSLSTGSTESKASESFRTQSDDASAVKSSISSTDPQDAPKENNNGWFNFFNLFQPKPASDAPSKPKDSVNNELRPIIDKEAKFVDTEKSKETVNERPRPVSESVKESASANSDKPRPVSESVKENASVNADKPKAPKKVDTPRKSDSSNKFNSIDAGNSRDSDNSNPRAFTEPNEDGAFSDEEFDD